MEHTLTSTLTNLGPNASKIKKALRKLVKQVNIQTQYLEVDLMDHRTRVDRQLSSLLHSLPRFVENRVVLPEDAIEERLVGSQGWLFECESGCFAERREAVVSSKRVCEAWLGETLNIKWIYCWSSKHGKVCRFAVAYLRH